MRSCLREGLIEGCVDRAGCYARISHGDRRAVDDQVIGRANAGAAIGVRCLNRDRE